MRTRILVKRAARLAAPLLLALLPNADIAAESKPLDCRALSEGFFKAWLTPQSSVKAVGQACLFTNIRFKAGTLKSYSVEQLQVAGLATWDTEKDDLPAQLDVDARGIRFSPEIDSARIRYQMAVSQRPFDIRLRFDWDEANRQFHLHEASLDGTVLGHLTLGLDAIFPAKDLPGAATMTKVRVSHAHLALDNGVLFETMLMPALIGLIPDDKDPAVEFPRKQKAIEQKLRDIPSTVIDPQGRDALIRFTRDFPHPTGHFEMDLNFATAQSLEAINLKKNTDWLNGARITASYQPAPATAR